MSAMTRRQFLQIFGLAAVATVVPPWATWLRVAQPPKAQNGALPACLPMALPTTARPYTIYLPFARGRDAVPR